MNRYEDVEGDPARTPTSTLNRNNYKQVVKALYNFQVRDSTAQSESSE